MKWLLDTNIISEASKANPDPRCMAWLEARLADCRISTVTVSELRYGIERLPEGRRKALAESEFEYLCEDFTNCFLDFDGPAATEWGRYGAELEGAYGSGWWERFDLRDTQIAATAREYGLVVATRNVRHFPFCKVTNPFDLENPALEPDA